MRRVLEAGTLLGVLVAGGLAGLASGLFGVGGGILMVPAALYLVPGTDFHGAKAVSLVVIIASASTGIWTHHRHQSVDFRQGTTLAIGGLGGAAVSALSVEHLDDGLLTAAFGIVLAGMGARLAFAHDPKPHDMPPRARTLYLLALGILAGILSGALGVGGGIIIVPGMVLAGIGIHLAIGTSLVAVLGNAIGGTASHLALGYGPVLLTLGIPLAIGAIPATWIGSKLAHKLHAERLERSFGAFLILVGLGMVIDATWVR